MIAKWRNVKWISQVKATYPSLLVEGVLYFIWLSNFIRLCQCTLIRPAFHTQPWAQRVSLYLCSLLYYAKHFLVVLFPSYAVKQTYLKTTSYKSKEDYQALKPAISIIVTTYNVEQYIEECIDSILAQTYTDFEVIIVDDCSTDATWKILQRYAKQDERIALYQHKKNQGHPSLGRNMGIKIAKASYLTFVDGDDYLRQDAIERFITIIKRHQPNMLYAGTWYFDDRTRRKQISKSFTNQQNAIDKLYLFDVLSANDNFWKFIFLGACPKVYQKDFLDKHKITFPAIRLEDISFSLLSYMYAESIYCYAEKVYFARQERTATSENRNTQVSISQSLAIIDTIRLAHSHFIKLKKLAPIREYLYFTFYILIARVINRYLPDEDWDIFLTQVKVLCKEIDMQGIAYTYFNDIHREDLNLMLSCTTDDYYAYHRLGSTNLSSLSKFVNAI